MKKIKIRIFATLFAVFLCLLAFPITALAGGGEEVPLIPEENEMPKTDPAPLTPDGNLTLVDDIAEEEAEDKQFVTLVSKSGNYFYLVIDRAGDKENVYFLNLVDESDLLALIEETDTAPETPLVTPQPEPLPEPTPEPEPQEEKSNSAVGILLILLIVGIAGGGFFYFKVLKNKGNTKGNTLLEEYDFEDDEDYDDEYEYENEDEDEEDESEDI